MEEDKHPLYRQNDDINITEFVSLRSHHQTDLGHSGWFIEVFNGLSMLFSLVPFGIMVAFPHVCVKAPCSY